MLESGRFSKFPILKINAEIDYSVGILKGSNYFHSTLYINS